MSMNRRAFLALLGAGGAAAALHPRWIDLEAAAAAATPIDPAFPHGIASGDPRPDGSVIWTRVDPAADPGAGVPVTWEVAADASFATILASGTVDALAAGDHTVHVEVAGLGADGWYHYRFAYAGHVSRIGRLRTAPAEGSSPDRLRFAFCSCQQINDSLYVAHAAMAAEDLDFVVHYGDYVYVSDGGTVTLDDYRAVYKRFKANPYLQDLHAALPMVVVWDDGEFVNGVDRTMEPVRFAAARQAWFDFQPVVRRADDPGRIHREIEWGDLVDVTMLDVRSRRDPYIGSNDDTTLLPTTDTALPSGAAIFDPQRTCLGAEQKAWLVDRLLADGFTWRHIGHGYPFVALRLEDYDTPAVRADPPPDFHPNGGKYLSTEQWDGYWAERRELMDLLADNCVENVVVTSGHTHIWFETGLRPDYDDLEGSPVVAREFTCGSLTADPDPRAQYFPGLPKEAAEEAIHGLEAAFLGINPHVGAIDLLNQGYGVVTFTPAEATVDFRVIDTFDVDAVATTSRSYRIGVGELPGPGACSTPPPGPTPPTTTPTTTSTTAPAGRGLPGVGPAEGARPVPGDPTYTG
ncbi:MAG TPA: alkaline phosphatase D family protein [Aquihabitans sp.]|nr:alkaline phosphatase D family protein [Aquihabitans sp.]